MISNELSYSIWTEVICSETNRTRRWCPQVIEESQGDLLADEFIVYQLAGSNSSPLILSR